MSTVHHLDYSFIESLQKCSKGLAMFLLNIKMRRHSPLVILHAENYWTDAYQSRPNSSIESE